jgi:hypothetical protein
MTNYHLYDNTIPDYLQGYPEAPKAFLELLFSGSNSGFTEFRLLAKDKAPLQLFYNSIINIDWSLIQRRNAEGYNIYYGVCLRRERKGDKSSVLATPSLWAELDAKDFRGEKDEALSQFERLPSHLLPSLIIDSGNGYHTYWLLSHPWFLRCSDDIQKIEGYIRGLGSFLKGDTVFDICRVLRLPGTLNMKNPGQPVPCQIICWEPHRHFDLSDFDDYWVDTRSSVNSEATVFSGQIPEVNLSQLAISGRTRRLIKEGWQAEGSYPSRSEADQAVITALLQAGCSYDTIRATFANPRWRIGDKYRDKGKYGDQYLTHSIARARAFLGEQGVQLNPSQRKSGMRQKDDATDEEPLELHLADAASSVYTSRRVRIPVHVIGKDTTPFILPKKVTLLCGDNDCKHKENCLLGGEQYEVTFSAKDALLTSMIGCSITQQKGAILQAAGIACKKVHIREPFDEVWNAEEILVQPKADHIVAKKEEGKEIYKFDGRLLDKEFVQRKVYVLSEGQFIRMNEGYSLEGYATRDSRTQYATILVDKTTPYHNSTEDFELTPPVYEKLKVFQPKEEQTIGEKFSEIYGDLEVNVTRIWERDELMLANDLCIHSAIRFPFEGKILEKGWVEGIVVGDTGQAKTSLTDRLLRHYGLGTLFSCDTAGRTGLKGVVEQINGRWFVKWGIVVLNHLRYIVLDEVAALPLRDLIQLRDLRSKGIAEIYKAASTPSTPCCTRMLWLSNPRDGLAMPDFTYGIEAIGKFVPPADLRRFDFGLIVKSGDVPTEVLNREDTPKVDHIYTSELCNALIRWVWSRRPEQIHILPQTEKAIKHYTTELSQKYVAGVALTEYSDLREKIARLSVSVAGRVFSTEDGIDLIIRPEHTEAGVQMLCGFYDAPNCSFDAYSKARMRQDEFDFDSINTFLSGIPRYLELARAYLLQNTYRVSDLEAIVGWTKDERQSYLPELMRMGLVRMVGNGVASAGKFVRYCRELEKKGAI